MAKKLYVDKHACSICMLCVDEYPQAFRITDDGHAEVFDASSLKEEEIQDIIALCPAGCIHYE